MDKPLVIITGASSGIGAATAKVFSEAGYPLGLIARRKTLLKHLNLPNTISLVADVTNYQNLAEAINSAENLYGPVDCLINNAGIAKFGNFTELSHEEQTQVFLTNVNGVINAIKIILPNMQQRKTGTIINISSLADRTIRPKRAAYAASKAAIKSLTESLRVANAKHGVRFCNIAPARISTPMLTAVQMNNSRTIPAEDFAKTIFWIYQQPQNICIRDMVFAPTSYTR